MPRPELRVLPGGLSPGGQEPTTSDGGPVNVLREGALAGLLAAAVMTLVGAVVGRPPGAAAAAALLGVPVASAAANWLGLLLQFAVGTLGGVIFALAMCWRRTTPRTPILLFSAAFGLALFGPLVLLVHPAPRFAPGPVLQLVLPALGYGVVLGLTLRTLARRPPPRRVHRTPHLVALSGGSGDPGDAPAGPERRRPVPASRPDGQRPPSPRPA